VGFVAFILLFIGRIHMALLAEEIVEEWLRRDGYFTIRGIKLGVQEIDLLAIRCRKDAEPECRHIEVQASMRPVSFISKVPKALQRDGRAANSAKRTDEEMVVGVKEWIEKKFRRPDKLALRSRLCPGMWTDELVLNNVKADEEVSLIAAQGIKILSLSAIVQELRKPGQVLASASGGDLADLLTLGANNA
jgi:hypothetical protein